MAENDERRIRKALVVAAEAVMERKFASGSGGKGDPWKGDKSQLSHLIGVTGEALCVEEIVNYLRYQSSRERPSLGPALVEAMIAGASGVLVELPSDRDKVAKWRHYAVFLARAFTYRNAIQKGRGA